MGGEAILPVYPSRVAAESHGLFMGREHRVVEECAADLADLLEEFASYYDLVAVDPPLAMEGGKPQPVLTVPAEEFIEELREEG